MTDPYTLAAAIFSAIATAFAALAAWNAPRAAAKLAETLRRDSERSQERQRNKLHVFASLMQERSAIYSETGVRALNIIDVVFHDCHPVREAWAELFLTFALKPIPDHLLEERLRKLLAAMAADIGLGENLKTDDFGRIYSPTGIVQDRFIRDMQRAQAIASLQNQQAPASNTIHNPQNLWPPKPE